MSSCFLTVSIPTLDVSVCQNRDIEHNIAQYAKYVDDNPQHKKILTIYSLELTKKDTRVTRNIILTR